MSCPPSFTVYILKEFPGIFCSPLCLLCSILAALIAPLHPCYTLVFALFIGNKRTQSF
ncbi:hypothetical protein AB205_0012380 [Aquarana catesbeiana]|uniref:Uncharacterized protein n=1 Tax=Aquarana catesbeiana TaxID=8400 RepID=A0A2G9SBN1_AQUCT|nr:hypothetical protein AB205_0012380 [Aquarana catesbeiana]